MVTVNCFHKFYHDTDLVPDQSMINNLTYPNGSYSVWAVELSQGLSTYHR